MAAAGGVILAMELPATAVPVTISFAITTPGNISVSNTDDNVGPGDAVTVTGTGSLTSTAGNITINAADAIVLQPGSSVSAFGTATLHAGAPDLDGFAGITIAGTARAAGPVTATAGPGHDTVVVDFPAGADLPSGLAVDGGTGIDTLDVDTATTAAPLLTITGNDAGILSGSYSFSDRPAITFAGIEALATVPDLAVTNTHGQDTAPAGSTVTATVVATNNGPVGLAGVVVTDDLPAALTGATWSCIATPGSTCGAAAGTGDLVDLATLSPGGSVTYSISATVDPTATGTLTTTATVAPPATLTDPNPGDNSATDETAVTAPPDDRTVTLLPPLRPSTADGVVHNDIQAGRVVPVKLTVSGDTPDALLALAVSPADCATGAPTAASTTTGELRWKPDDGAWIHNLHTRALGLERGACYRVDAYLGNQLLTDDTWALLRVR